jgi:hypothetical protein
MDKKPYDELTIAKTESSSSEREHDNLDLLREISETRLRNNRTDLPITFREPESRDIELLEEINETEELTDLRRTSLENIVNNNINMSFFDILSTTAPHSFHTALRETFNSSTANRSVYTPFVNILLLASPGTIEISEVVQLLINNVSEPEGETTITAQEEIAHNAEEARQDIQRNSQTTDRNIDENAREREEERNRIERAYSASIWRYVRNGIIVAGSSLAIYLGQPLWRPLIRAAGEIALDTLRPSRNNVDGTSQIENPITTTNINENLLSHLINETARWIKRWWNNL